MKKNIFLILIPFCSFLLTSCMCSKTDSKRVAMKQNKTTLSKDACGDAKFAVCAADDGLLAVKVSELAQSNAASASVKKFAQTEVTDHSKSNDELRSLASSKKISLPEKLSDKSQKAYEWMSKKKGEDFDKAYMKCMVRHHKMAINEFEKASKKAKDPELQKWASSKLPEMKNHLEMANAICKESKEKK